MCVMQAHVCVWVWPCVLQAMGGCVCVLGGVGGGGCVCVC